MANLLYAENNIGCALDWPSQDYWYGRESYMSSYYADLEPNTTYTIKRIDTSTRFRLGLSAQDLKFLSSSSQSSVTRPFAWTRQVDSSDAVTFTTDATAIHMVIYYTNNSEYNTRVMLNEGSSIEPYEAPTRYFKNHWRLINGKLINNDLPESIENNLTPPYPASMWRLDSDDILTLNSEDWSPLPEALDSFTPPYPATMWYLDEHDRLISTLLPEPIDDIFTYPYPVSLWWYDSSEKRLMEILQPDAIPLGAFVNCRNLTYIKLPSTVTRIGREAFYNSGLTLVRIPAGCTYYPTSFPPGCEIQTYSV